MEAGVQIAINTAIRKLYRIDPYVRKYIKEDLGQAASIVVSAIKARTPVGTRPHGKYKPGNLKKSIRVLPLRRARSSAVVGPLTRGGTIDGFYARFLEKGTRFISARRFIEAGKNASLPVATRFALRLLMRRIDSYGKQNSI